jgi:hypothetical protein
MRWTLCATPCFHALDEVVLVGEILVVGHHHPSKLTDRLHPPHRPVAAELRLQALSELVDLGRFDPSDLDMGAAGPGPYALGPATWGVE